MTDRKSSRRACCIGECGRRAVGGRRGGAAARAGDVAGQQRRHHRATAACLQMSDEEWRSVLDRQPERCAFHMLRACAPGRSRPAAAGLSTHHLDSTACAASLGQHNYTAAKAGMIGSPRPRRAELGPKGITRQRGCARHGGGMTRWRARAAGRGAWSALQRVGDARARHPGRRYRRSRRLLLPDMARMITGEVIWWMLGSTV